MPTRCLLIPTIPGAFCNRRYHVAYQLARRMSCHIDVLSVSEEPARLLAAMPEVALAAGFNEETLAKETRQAILADTVALKSWCQDNGVKLEDEDERLDAVYLTRRDIVGELEAEVALAGRVHDLIVIDTPDRSKPFTESVFDAAVFSTGRPTLVVPPTDIPPNLLEHVVIAFNGSVEAARVLGQSINILHEANRVTIIEVQKHNSEVAQSEDLARYLRFHGIKAHVRCVKRRANENVAETILSIAKEGRASLLMMGAYTHSRLRELFVGGVTQHMIRCAAFPLLMAH